jgi:amino acid adenylation domain-containing protein
MENVLLHKDFEHCAQKYPGKIAVAAKSRDITYLLLNRKANYLSHILHGIGAGKDTVVSYLGVADIELVISLLGIFKSGSIYLPVDAALPDIRMKQMLKETGCKIAITTRAYRQTILGWNKEEDPQLDYLVVLTPDYLETGLLRRDDSGWHTIKIPCDKITDDPTNTINEEDPSYIFYTSGSASDGKPIVGCHKGLTHFINWERNEFKFDNNIRVSQLTRIGFDASLRDIFIPLVTGGTLFIPGEEVRSNTSLLIEWLQKTQVHLVHTVPSFFRLLNKEMREGGYKKENILFPSLQWVLMAGEPLYAKDVSHWRDAAGDHTELVILYGTSETTLAKTFHRIKEIPDNPGQRIHAGQPIEGAFVAIVNNNELCRVGEIGDVYIKTPYRTKGYYNNPALTALHFVQNPVNNETPDIVHKTGDIGRYLPDRSIEIIGRTDDQVKVNGVRVELHTIGQCMMCKEGVEQAVVLSHKNNEQFTELIAYYTGEADQSAVRQYLHENLCESIVPGYIVRVDEFPVSVNGKINTRELPHPDEMMVSDFTYEKVSPGIESELEQLWKDLLGIKRIGRKVSFFEIGGNSLKAIQLVSRIYKSFKVLLKISEIFAHQSIEALALLIKQAGVKQLSPVTPMEEQDHYELSVPQQRLWISSQYNPAAYNIAMSYQLEGKLNKKALQEAFESVVDRHESLRTSFVAIGGIPRQKVHDISSPGFSLTYIDLKDEKDNLATAKRMADEQAVAPFDIEKGPLFNATLVRLSENQHVFLFTIHHILFDAWSMDILVSEVMSLYNGICNRKDSDLEEIKIQYKDYSRWLREQLALQNTAVNKKQWLSSFDQEAPVTKLPVDFPADKSTSPRGNAIYFVIDQELATTVKTLCRKNDITPFQFFFTVVNTLLYRYTGQQDIVIGSPLAGRLHPDLEKQIGFFVNLVALRTKFTGETIFSNLLQEVKKTTLEAYNEQLYPFSWLLDDNGVQKEQNRSRLFNVVTQFVNNQMTSADGRSFESIRVSHFLQHSYTSKFDISFIFGESANKDEFFLNIEFRTDLFKESTVTRMGEDLLQLVKIVTQQPGLTIDNIKQSIAGQSTGDLINKNELYTPVITVPDEDYQASAPLNEMESMLEKICRQVLGQERIGRKVSFFSIGGSSLSAMQYIFSIYRELGVLISFEDLYENNSIEKLGAYISLQLNPVFSEPSLPEEKKTMVGTRLHMLNAS